MGRLDGKVAAVSGGASGIGEATVRLMVEEGARVCFADRDVAGGTAIAGEIKGRGGEVLFVEAYLRREADDRNFIERTVEQFGQLHILVNNAGEGVNIAPTSELSDEGIERSIASNLTGALLGCRRAAAIMAEQKS